MSYLQFYHLSREPFKVTPDPEFLFLSPSHKEALGAFIYGITRRKGIVAIVGEVGVGKTTVLRSYLEDLDQKSLKTIYLFNANLSFADLARTLCDELGIQHPAESVYEMVNQIHLALIELFKQGKNVVLIVDEAQNMPIETLENLRMLSNLETAKDKLIQIILIGQPELEEKLNLHELRQLRQRIAVRSTIVALSAAESMDYIQHRLIKSGMKSEVFSKDALKMIVKEAKGIPRVMNILGDNSLITGFGYQQRPIQTKVVQEVINDMKGIRDRSVLKWSMLSTAGMLLLGTVVWLFAFRNGALEQFQQEHSLVQAHETVPAPKKADPVVEPQHKSQPDADAQADKGVHMDSPPAAENNNAGDVNKEAVQQDQKAEVSTSAPAQKPADSSTANNDSAKQTTTPEKPATTNQSTTSAQPPQVAQNIVPPPPVLQQPTTQQPAQPTVKQKSVPKKSSAKKSMPKQTPKSVKSSADEDDSASQSYSPSWPHQQKSDTADSRLYDPMWPHTQKKTTASDQDKKDNTGAVKEVPSERVDSAPQVAENTQQPAPAQPTPSTTTNTQVEGGRKSVKDNSQATTTDDPRDPNSWRSIHYPPQNKTEQHNYEPASKDSSAPMGNDVTRPEVLHVVNPGYPAAAMRKGVEGTVVVSILVSPEGDVEAVRILRSADSSYGLDDAAVAAVAKWKFRPAVRDGKPIRVWTSYPVVFRLR